MSTKSECEASTKKPRVKLVGRDGNAFSILAACKTAAKKAGWSKEQISAFMQQAMSADYDNLLAVACEHFDVR